MDAKQFAWAYLIRGGKCNVKPGYYGGFEHMSHMKIPKHANPHAKEWNDPYLAEIKEFGVDWEKTKSPRGDAYYTFQGTECDSGREEKLTGTLVLKNGTTQFWHGDPPLSDIFELMAARDILVNFAEETFGCK